MKALLLAPLGLLVGASLGALGAGGSILAVPALVYVGGLSFPAATTTSLVVIGSASAVGAIDHWRAGRVRAGLGVGFGVCGILGSVAGSILNRTVDADLLMLAFAGLVGVAAWRMVTACPTCTKAGEAAAVDRLATDAGGREELLGGRRGRRTFRWADLASVVVAGSAVGFFTGLFGVGGGFLAVPALTLLLRVPMGEAVGTSLLVIVLNSLSALGARVGQVDVEGAVAGPFALAALVGVVVGGRVADRIPAATTLRWFAGLLVAVAIYTAARSLVAIF